MNYEPTRVLYTGLREPDSVEGVSTFHLPALQFRTLSFSIVDMVDAIERCDTVCVSSSRAIESIRKEPRVLGALLDVKPALFVVGEQTAKNWVTHIDPRCEPVVCRTFNELVGQLQLSPELRQVVALEWQDGPRSLTRTNVPQGVDAFSVYATARAIPAVKVWGEVEAFAPEWVAFTSPRGVASFADRLSKLKSSVRVASIGPTTTTAIQKAGLVVSAEADRPSAESLLRVILKESI